MESHINYYREASAGEPLAFTTQILGLDEKRLHLFHRMTHGETGGLLSVTEQMLLHVDMTAGRACPIRPEVMAALEAIWAVHRDLPRPDEAGRQMAIPAKG